MERFACRGWPSMVNLVEDENDKGYTIRSDLMEDGESIECIEDHDMHVRKEGDSVVLVKKCFSNNCFSK